MYQLVVNKQYNIIEDVFEYKMSSSHLEDLIELKPSTTSIIPNCETYSVKKKEIPQHIYESPQMYIYDNDNYYIRPYISFYVLNNTLHHSRNTNEPFLPINTDIEVKPICYNPDNVPHFDNTIDYLNIFDQYDYLHNIPSILDNLDDSFIIKSGFPTTIKLIAKDNNLLYYSIPFIIKFREL